MTGYASGRSVSVTGAGDCGAHWQTTKDVLLIPGQTYVVRYWAAGSDAIGYGMYGDLESVGRRSAVPVEHWAPYGYAAVAPANVTGSRFRVGQCALTGKLSFDKLTLRPAQAVSVRTNMYSLGAGESFRTNRYSFQTKLGDFHCNYSRCLEQHTATFGGDTWNGYWAFSSGQFVTYRHGFAGLSYTNAKIKATLSYYLSGDLLVEVGTDGQDWQEIGRLRAANVGGGTTTLETNLPAAFLPASVLFVRLRATGSVQLSSYQFEGEVASSLPGVDGYTWFFEHESPNEEVALLAMTDTPTGHVITLAVPNTNDVTRELAVQCQIEGPAGIRHTQETVIVSPWTTNEVAVMLPAAGVDENIAWITVKDGQQGRTLLNGSVRFIVSAMRDDSFGARLPAPAECPVWWCGSTHKVGRERPVPTLVNDAVQISAARNEYEPFQIVLRPEITLSNVNISVSDFILQSPVGGGMISSTNVEICLVDYVPVARPTDYTCRTDPHPDPLIPLSGDFAALSRSNQPVWITLYVPKHTPAGDYYGLVTLQSSGLLVTVPIRLHVFDFSLPDVTHTRTAYAVNVDQTWHKPANVAQERFIWELYMENFRRHRVSPYAPHLYAPVTWTFVNGRFTHNFADFDAAMTRYLDDFHFNSFNLMGHKSPMFPTQLGGYPQFTPEYSQLLEPFMQPIMRHLREKGWSGEAYCYWYDEPATAAIPFVIEGMQAIQQAAPGLRRFLTVEPVPTLYRHVDVWTPLISSYDYYHLLQRLQQRQAAGDETWWYVCTGPLAPRPNNFLDHPAINHRIRFWLAERYRVSGDLYWAANYWVGRNPWTNTWSFGNGDGALLYPPVRIPPSSPVLAGPINSIRWELVRESLEDSEYFWLLKQALARGELRLGPVHPRVLEARAAREAALGLAPSPKWFNRNPQTLEIARQRLAAAIELLDDGAPMMVNAPRSQAAPSGGSLTLNAEALGWPLPAYQWRLHGTNLPGATDPQLVLSNCGPLQAGDYTVVASNVRGNATSAVAQVAGYWSTTPAIISNLASVVRPFGETAVFAITAVSTNPLSYHWLFEGIPMNSTAATNSTLLLTNLTTEQTGDYSVVLSNVSGVITSAPARLSVLCPTIDTLLVSTGAVWRYYDLHSAPDSAWHTPGYADGAWKSGPAQLGYGEGDEVTVVAASTDKPVSVYFRHTLTGPEGVPPARVQGRLVGDDGSIVYINGVEVFRDNLPTGTITHATQALDAKEGQSETEVLTFPIPVQLLQPGTNLVAVEVHQHTNGAALALQPAAYWTLDEIGPVWNDLVGTNSLSGIGPDVVAGNGKINGCVSNSYSYTDHLIAPASLELNFSGPFTVGGWFAFGAGTDLRANCLQITNEFSLFYTGTTVNRYRFEVNGSTVQDATSGTRVGQWRFVVGWFDGSNACIQVDNAAIYSLPAVSPATTANPLVALKKVNLTGGFAGDELFLFKRVLTAEERTTLYTGGVRTEDLSFAFELKATWGQLPLFPLPPTDMIQPVGGNAAFSMTAVSADPVSYQWNFNGVPMPGATNSLLFLEGVTLASAGDYTLTARNLAGSATSAPGALRVFDTPQLNVQSLTTNAGFILQVPACELPCTVLVSSNLVDWSELVVLPPSLNATNLVNFDTPDAPSRFYQLRLQP